MENKDLVWIIVAIVFGLFLLSGLFGAGRYGGMMGMMYSFGYMPLLGWLVMILVVVALVLFIIWLSQQLQNPKSRRY